MTASDSDRILAGGRTVTFKDGSQRIVAFEFVGLKFVEDEMGGLFSALAAFGVEIVDKQIKFRIDQSVVFNTVAKALACGVAHEFTEVVNGKIRLPEFGQVSAWVYLNADAKRVNEYAQACFDSLIEAIPDLTGNAAEEAQGSLDPPQADDEILIQWGGGSPGNGSTTSQLFVTSEMTSPSGG
jgi:hypothetical protein